MMIELIRMRPAAVLVAFFAIFSLSACGGDDSTGPSDDNPPSGDYAVIETWAGIGVNGASPEGTALTAAELSTPMDVEFSPDGVPHILDWNNHRVLQVRDGKIHMVIGNGTLGAGVEGPVLDDPDTPELEAGLNHPTHVSWDPQGRIVLSAWHNSKIMRCDLVSGFMTRLAGLESEESNGNRCWNGDDNDAVDSCLDLPVCTGFDAAGNLYIADQKNLRIRKVTPVGGEISTSATAGDRSPIETIVGTGYVGSDGLGGYNGNGLPGTETHMRAPGGQSAPPSSKMLVRPDGEIYFADSANNMVRRLGTDGIVYAVAGGGDGLDPVTGVPNRGYSGDGGPATDATLYFPTDVAMDSEGNIYIADAFNSAIRKVDTNGIITTFAGRGERNPSAPIGDGGPPDQAWLDRPFGVSVDADDNVYITDTYHNRIRIVRK
jgi:streptogramin lyase